MTSVRNPDRELFRRLLLQARPYWPHIAGIFVLDLLATPLALLSPLPLKLVVDSLVGSAPLPGFLAAVLPEAGGAADVAVLGLAAGLAILIAFFSEVRGLAGSMLRTFTGERLVLEFRATLFRHLQRLSLSHFDMQGTGDLTYRIRYDAPAIREVAIEGVIPFITSSVTLIGMIYVTAWLDWQLAAVALVVSPILMWLSRTGRRTLRGRWKEFKRQDSRALAVVQEALSAIRVVRAFGQEEREEERFIRQSSEGLQGKLQVTFLGGRFDLLVGLTLAAGTAAALTIGVLHVRAGLLTLGNLLVVTTYLSQLYGPLEKITKKATGMQSELAGAERAFAVLDIGPDVIEHPNARPLARGMGAVEFRDVFFLYEHRPTLRKVSFKVPAGSRVGLRGPTGAGKSTLVSLLPRFYDPTAGQILLDGVDLRDYRLADLRNQFAIVLQDTLLFSTSIAENIAYARPRATEEEIVAAAKAARAHDFISQLPDGYQTLVGERGMRLSGGERQRISLARAFLKDAPILILDEPTSAVDMQTEAEIVAAMEQLMQGRTTFMIAHRLSTLRGCDLLLTIGGGRVKVVGGAEAVERELALAEAVRDDDELAVHDGQAAARPGAEEAKTLAGTPGVERELASTVSTQKAEAAAPPPRTPPRTARTASGPVPVFEVTTVAQSIPKLTANRTTSGDGPAIHVPAFITLPEAAYHDPQAKRNGALPHSSPNGRRSEMNGALRSPALEMAEVSVEYESPRMERPSHHPTQPGAAPEGQTDAGLSTQAGVAVAGHRLQHTFVFVSKFPNYRLVGDLAIRLDQWLRHFAVAYHWRAERIVVHPDYVIAVISCPPSVAPEHVARRLKRLTSDGVFTEFPRLVQGDPSRDFWAPGYLISHPGHVPMDKEIADFIVRTRQRQGLAQ